MPNKIKSGKQLRFLEMASKKGISGGPSKEVATKMLSHESDKKKKTLARMK